MRKKLKSRRGVSVAEMLVAVILLSLLTAGGVGATTAVMADYNRMQDAANAEILASTVIEALSNEIRFGKDITVDASGDSLTLGLSAFFGENATLRLEDGHLVAETIDAAGAPKVQQLLSESTYGGLSLAGLKFEEKAPDPPDPGKKTVYEITFTVTSEYSGTLWTARATAASLTPPAPAGP